MYIEHLLRVGFCCSSQMNLKLKRVFSPLSKKLQYRYVCVCVCVHAHMLSWVQLFATPWTIAPVNCCPLGSSVHGILQAIKMEWVAMPRSRGFSQPRDRTRVSCISCICRQILYHRNIWEAHLATSGKTTHTHTYIHTHTLQLLK